MYRIAVWFNVMYTMIETPTFVATADGLWSDDERLDFLSWLAANPEAGAVIPGSGGCRKVRWSTRTTGKRGGARVIYFLYRAPGEIWLLMAYSKSDRDTIPMSLLNAIREEIQDGH